MATQVLEHLRLAKAHMEAALTIARADQETTGMFCMESVASNLRILVAWREDDERRMRDGSYR